MLCTEWEEFGELDLGKLKDVMVYRVVVDRRNFFDAERITEAGFSYYPMGRRNIA